MGWNTGDKHKKSFEYLYLSDYGIMGSAGKGLMLDNKNVITDVK